MPQFCSDIDEVDQCLEAICDADSMKTDDDLVSELVVTCRNQFFAQAIEI